MAVKFFARFNLHNSICSEPISVKALRPFFDMTDGEIADMLNEIDEIQNERVKRLQNKYPSELKLLTGKKVLFLGDSITSDNLGYRTTVTKAAKLCAVDGSVSGGTSSMILYDAKMLIEKHKPDIVSIMIGSNDSVSILENGLNQVSIEEYRRNVSKIAEWAKKSGAAVLLFEIPPIVPWRFEKSFSKQLKIQSNETVLLYNEALRDIAEQSGIKLHSNGWLSEDENFYEPDGIHLSVIGQELFANKWIEAATK